ENELFLRRDGHLIPIEKPADANAFTYRDLLFIELRTAWNIAGHTYPAGALLAAGLEEFLNGQRQFAVLFEPAERQSPAGSGPAFFNTAGLSISQHETTSKDGTRIPYFQVAPKDLKLEGKNPTLLYGYGGFEILLVPGYSPLAGAAWMERGGVYVVANIRGG